MEEALAKEMMCLKIKCPKFFSMICFWQAVIKSSLRGVTLATSPCPRLTGHPLMLWGSLCQAVTELLKS